MTQTTRWWWVRHGPVHNPDRRLYGQLDLDAHFPDAGAVAALAARLPGDALWLTSHLRRTHQTADALFNALEKKPGTRAAHAALAEQHFGEWQGLSFSELRKLGDDFERIWSAPGATRPPGGENFADVIARVAPVIEDLTARHAGRDIIAIAHGGTIRAALALALGLDADTALGFRIDTLSLTRIDFVPEGRERTPGSLRRWRIEAVNLPPLPSHACE
jgi:alpha-ribazole phosphatase